MGRARLQFSRMRKCEGNPASFTPAPRILFLPRLKLQHGCPTSRRLCEKWESTGLYQGTAFSRADSVPPVTLSFRAEKIIRECEWSSQSRACPERLTKGKESNGNLLFSCVPKAGVASSVALGQGLFPVARLKPCRTIGLIIVIPTEAGSFPSRMILRSGGTCFSITRVRLRRKQSSPEGAV